MSLAVDRSKAPALIKLKELQLQEPGKLVLQNGMPVYTVSGLKQDVVRLDFVFNAGRWYEAERLQARMAVRMMREGSEKYPSREFAEKLDYYGASIKAAGGSDVCTISLFCMNKFLPQVLPIFQEVLKEPAFKEEDLRIIASTAKQNLKVNLEKNEFLADKHFSETIFGESHPYGYELTPQDYDNCHVDGLRKHYMSNLHAGNGFIIASGNVTEQVVKYLQQYFGGNDWLREDDKTPINHIIQPGDRTIHMPKEGSFQSSIRIGMPAINKSHLDQPLLSIMNTIFGGYFGSRLMSNLREDKGYTYGVYSVLASMRHGSYLQVTTDVGAGVRDAAVQEIYREMKRLREEPVPQDELELVRNYLLGKLQARLDGPFKQSTMLKDLLIYDLNIDYIYRFTDAVNSFKANDIQEFANRYLVEDSMFEVIVG